MIDIKEVQAQAEKELRDEKLEEAKQKVKGKLIQIHNAEIILKNLRRELEDLYVQIRHNS